MITIIHGDDILRSRKFFSEQKARYSDPVVIEGKELVLEAVKQVFEGGSLFGNEKALFIENFFVVKKASKDFKVILSYIKELENGDVFLWEAKELSKSETSFAKNAVVKVFLYPKDIFAFLESLRPGNKQAVVQFHSALRHAEAELLFFMLIRQFRLLLAFSDGISDIDEVKRMAPWQQSKISKQAAYFSVEQLKKIYKKLFEIDVAAKTGKSVFSLTQAIDILLLEM